MSNVQEMPELMGALEVLTSTRVFFNDKSMWTKDALDAAIEKMVAKAYKFTKQSEITLHFKFNPGPGNTLEIEASLKTKEPEPKAQAKLAYTDSRGRLYGDDPQQTRLPLDNSVEMRRHKD